MRNLLLTVSVVLGLVGCGKTGIEVESGKMPYDVLSRSADAKLEVSEISATSALVKMKAAALGNEQNYRFKLTLKPGGSVELRARAKADLSGGVVVKFARTDKGVTFKVNDQDLTADVAKALGDGSKEIDVNFDIHRHSDHSHGFYEVNGKKGAAADFDVKELQGNWGFKVDNATVRAFAVGPAKHED